MLGLLLALWSVLLTGEPIWLHDCPTMPSSAVSAEPSEGIAGAAVSPESHAHHEHAAANAPNADESSHHSDSSPHECNCVGVCASASVIAAPVLAIVRVPAPAEVISATTQYPKHTSVDARPAPSSRLPWPTAPPVLFA